MRPRTTSVVEPLKGHCRGRLPPNVEILVDRFPESDGKVPLVRDLLAGCTKQHEDYRSDSSIALDVERETRVHLPRPLLVTGKSKASPGIADQQSCQAARQKVHQTVLSAVKRESIHARF